MKEKHGDIQQGIAVIVLNWQGWPDTLQCLESLHRLTWPTQPSTIIVCDNASENDSFSRILTWARQYYAETAIGLFHHPPHNPSCLQHKPFVLIQTGANLGFAGGHNVGLCYALAQGYGYFWLLNNDTVVDSCALTALYQCAQQDKAIALWGSTMIDFEQRDKVACAGGCYYFPRLTVFKRVLGDSPLQKVMQQTTPVKLDYVYGAALFLRATAVTEVGLLNEEYFLFYEELDYTQRLKQHGYHIGWCKASWVYHKGSASVGSVKTGSQQQRQRAHYYENLSTLKYTARFYPRWLLWVMALRWSLKSVILIKRGDFYLFSSLFKAYRDFIRLHYLKK